MPFDGLEGHYGRMTADKCQRWIKIAQYRNWLITGGSDFHGEIKPLSSLGSSWIGEETFQKLYVHFQEQSQK